MKRKLKPIVKTILTIIAIILLPILMVDDMSVAFAPIYLVLALVELASIYLVMKY